MSLLWPERVQVALCPEGAFARGTHSSGDGTAGEAVHAMTLTNLSGEFAEIVTADDVIAALELSARPPGA